MPGIKIIVIRADIGDETVEKVHSGLQAVKGRIMRLRRDVHRNMIDRFTAKADHEGHDQIERMAVEDSGRIHFRRFIRMVAARKQTILERLLMDES